MPTPKTPPQSLDAWLREFSYGHLPATASQIENARYLLHDSRKSMREIAEQLHSSPSIALALLRESNRHTSTLSEPAETLELAINRLGLQRSDELLQRIPTFSDSASQLPLRQLQLISLHAAQQANGLFAPRLARLWPEVQWASLLFLAPLWALAATYPELFYQWEKRVLSHGENACKVERELLGTRLMPLCLGLAKQWRLPSWIINGYRLLSEDQRQLIQALHISRDYQHPLQQRQQLDALPQLRRWLTLPDNCIVLANGLALSSHHNWHCEHHLRWQRLCGLYLQLPLEQLQQQVHQLAVRSARHHSQADLWHPAQALIWPTGSCRLTTSKAKPAVTPQPREALEQWKQHCTRLLSKPSAFSNVLQLTGCAATALQAAGLKRVLLLLSDRSQSRLHSAQALGLGAETIELKLEVASSQVLRRLLAEPSQLRVGPSNMAQVSALLPGSLKSLFQGDHLLLRSLANNGRVVMLMVADIEGQEFSPELIATVNKTAQCIELALQNFARRAG